MFSESHMEALKVSVEGNALRQRLVASNVANINTPGYKTKDLSFEKLYQMRTGGGEIPLKLTHPRHMQGMDVTGRAEGAIFNAYNPVNPHDGINDVDLDREMIKNSETALNMKMFGKLLKDRYIEMRNIIDSTP